MSRRPPMPERHFPGQNVAPMYHAQQLFERERMERHAAALAAAEERKALLTIEARRRAVATVLQTAQPSADLAASSQLPTSRMQQYLDHNEMLTDQFRIVQQHRNAQYATADFATGRYGDASWLIGNYDNLAFRTLDPIQQQQHNHAANQRTMISVNIPNFQRYQAETMLASQQAAALAARNLSRLTNTTASLSSPTPIPTLSAPLPRRVPQESTAPPPRQTQNPPQHPELDQKVAAFANTTIHPPTGSSEPKGTEGSISAVVHSSRDQPTEYHPRNLMDAKLAKRKREQQDNAGGTKKKRKAVPPLFPLPTTIGESPPGDAYANNPISTNVDYTAIANTAAAAAAAKINTASTNKEEDTEAASPNASWEEMFQRLVKFKEKYGTCAVPFTYHKKDPKFVAWVQNQKQRVRTMLSSRKQRLEELGFFKDAHAENHTRRTKVDFTAIPNTAAATTVASVATARTNQGEEEMEPASPTASWEEMFQRLVNFKKKYGTCTVPFTYHKEDPKLVAWAQNQKQRVRTMLSSRKRLLEEIGFFNQQEQQNQQEDSDDSDFDSEEDDCKKPAAIITTTTIQQELPIPQDKDSTENLISSDPLWNKFYKYLVVYKDIHGDCHVPSLYAGQPKLGFWVHALRHHKQLSPFYPLSKPQEQELKNLGLVFLGELDFNEMYERLISYKKQHGHCCVPHNYVPDKVLGFWVYYQRHQYHDEEESTDIIQEEHQKLIDIGFDFEFKTLASSTTALSSLQKDRERHQCQTSNNSTSGNQDKQVVDPAWLARYEKLVEFKSEHGNCFVSTSSDEVAALGTWVRHQWSNQDNLPLVCKQALMDIDFPFSTSDWNIFVDASISASGQGKIKKWHERDSWEEKFKLLSEYKAQNGNCDVPTRYKENPSLGRWIAKQRLNRHKMEPSRKQRLNNIGFHWSGTREWKESWSIMYSRLVKYKEEHGNCLVPMRYKNDTKLGIWVRTQREKKEGQMSAERLRLLNDIGFVWRVKKKDHTWQQMYNRLIKYKELYGDCMVPQRYKNDPKLGRWVNSQRLGRAMSSERRQKLNDVGFVWNLRRSADQDAEIGNKTYTDVQWNDMYQRLLEYKEENGSCHIPNNYKDDPDLLCWVKNQRMNRDKLSDYCRKCLEEIGFSWSSRKVTVIVAWDEMYERLRRFKEENGHAVVPHAYKPDTKLGVWVRTQRQFKETMPESRKERLDAIGFVWKARRDFGDSWDNMFLKLVEFKEKHGHCNVPQRYTEDTKLGRWVNSQRLGRPMSDERRQRLKEIGFLWSPSFASWDEMFNRLVTYKDQHGDCMVPYRYQNDTKLGGWVQTQRTSRNSMSKDRRDRLDEIGFAWSVRKDYARDAWNDMFFRLVEYKARHGDCLVPQQYKDDAKLGRWVHFQRQKKDSMPENRAQRLKNIGFVWYVGKKT